MNPIRPTPLPCAGVLLRRAPAFAQADKAERAQQMAAEMQKRFAAADAMPTAS